MKPKRIQRRRTRGWRMPPNTIYVGRPSRWGNPFSDGKDVVEWFRWWLAGELSAGWDKRSGLAVQAEARIALRGKDLACWCPLSRKCHADVLLELANAP
jgi:Domain of unknown function (DUF4326)